MPPSQELHKLSLFHLLMSWSGPFAVILKHRQLQWTRAHHFSTQTASTTIRVLTQCSNRKQQVICNAISMPKYAKVYVHFSSNIWKHSIDRKNEGKIWHLKTSEQKKCVKLCWKFSAESATECAQSHIFCNLNNLQRKKQSEPMSPFWHNPSNDFLMLHEKRYKTSKCSLPPADVTSW